MFHHEGLWLPLQSATGVGHDFVAGQCREVREERRVDERGTGEVFKEGKSKMGQCVHWEICADWRGAEQSSPIEWHNVRS